MPCYFPLQAAIDGFTSSGKKKLVFSAVDSFPKHKRLQVPCGQCIGCRLERSRQWAMRCLHESKMYDDNCFITLTYDDEHLPEGNTLVKRDFQLFIKRLRKRYGKVRYFACGEYGDQFGRPHYHALLFGFDFSDRKRFKSINGNVIYSSDMLSDLWPFGYSSVANVTFLSAAYVARYCLKKRTGKGSSLFYTNFDYESGEVFSTREREYVNMSRRPGIGMPWLQEFMHDTYKDDFCVIDGAKVKPPRFYDNKYEIVAPSDLSSLKEKRKKNALQNAADNTRRRLDDKLIVLKSKIKLLNRRLDGEI